jgi:hypothetical protein
MFRRISAIFRETMTQRNLYIYEENIISYTKCIKVIAAVLYIVRISVDINNQLAIQYMKWITLNLETK